MKHLEKRHPLAIRWFHWANFPLLALMIWSGILIYWANDIYRIGLGDITILPFFPDWFYEFFGLHHRLAEGMSWHFALMWLFIINGVLYVGYTVISGEWRHLLPDRRSFGEAWRVMLHDLHLRKEAPAVRERYNGAQRIAYTAVVLMGIGSLLTGLAIYKPTQLAWLCDLLGGYEAARAEHFILTIGYVLFFIVHIVQVIRAGWSNFRGMVSGYEIVERRGADAVVEITEGSHE